MTAPDSMAFTRADLKAGLGAEDIAAKAKLPVTVIRANIADLRATGALKALVKEARKGIKR